MVGRHGGENDDSFATHVSYRRLPCLAMAYCHNPRARRRTGNGHRVRCCEPDRRSGEAGPAVQRKHGDPERQGTLLLRGFVRARSTDRGWGAGGHLHFGQRRMDDYLVAKNLIVTATRVSPVGNTLVMIAPADSPLAAVEID